MNYGNCPGCGVMAPDHTLECLLRHQDKGGGGGNAIALLAAPFVVFSIPFIVVVFPVASLTAILVSIAVYRGLGPLMQETPAFWLTLLIALIPFLAALNLELWVERFWLYRVGRHVLRVVGVPWLAAQYIIYGPQFFGPSHHVHMLSFSDFVAQIFSRPAVLVTMIVLAWLAHLVGSSFDLDGSRPESWGRFFKPRSSVFVRPAPRVATVGRAATPRKPPGLVRKLQISTALAFAVGIVCAIVLTDYDSAVMVILRIGLLCAVVFGGVVLGHHVLATKRAGVRPRA